MRLRPCSWTAVVVVASCAPDAGPAPGAAAAAEHYRPSTLLAAMPSDSVAVELGRATSLDVSEYGLLVADRMNRRVIVFDHAGTVRQVLGREGRGPGEFKSPAEVEWGPDGSIWVRDASLLRLSRFSRDGRFLESFRSPASSFAVAGSSAVALPTGDPRAVVVLVDGGVARLLEADRDLFTASRRRSPVVGLRQVRAVARPGDWVAVWDNLDGSLWRSDLREESRGFGRVAVPLWFLERARARQEARAAALAVPSSSTPVVPLVQRVHRHGSGAVWLSTGWTGLIGLSVPLAGTGAPTVVIPRRGEHEGLVDSQLEDSTLYALYGTELRVYRLAPVREPSASRGRTTGPFGR